MEKASERTESYSPTTLHTTAKASSSEVACSRSCIDHDRESQRVDSDSDSCQPSTLRCVVRSLDMALEVQAIEDELTAVMQKQNVDDALGQHSEDVQDFGTERHVGDDACVGVGDQPQTDHDQRSDQGKVVAFSV